MTNSSSLPDLHLQEALQDLRNNSEINPVDKANGNAVIIWKRVYPHTLIKELGLNKIHNVHKTYK